MDSPRAAAEGPDTVSSLGQFKPLRGEAADEITRRLVRAVFEHRLPPGTRITEAKLGETFGVSRTLARQATAQLCDMGVFVKRPNQSCIVAHPSREDARALIDARRMVEPELIRRIVQSASAAEMKTLTEHVQLEQAARQRGDRATLIRLTGEFHLKLAELSGNPFLASFMMRLQILTCLAILVHGEGESGCPRDEHGQLVRLMEKQDSCGAVALMVKHLDHIELELRLNDVQPSREIEDTFRWLSGHCA